MRNTYSILKTYWCPLYLFIELPPLSKLEVGDS